MHNPMKFNCIQYILVLGVLFAVGKSLPAQQLPLAPAHVFRLDGLNPASSGFGDLNQVEARYRQQGFMVDGWRSIHQFLNFHSRPFDEKQRFGWGIGLTGDQEHTERRIALAPSIAARLAETENFRFSMGFAAGLIHWTSIYSNRRYFDQEDALLQGGFSFLEVNASIGARFAYQNNWIRGGAQVMGDQLPGSVLTNRLDGIPVRPHVMASGEALFKPVYNIWVGPLAFYRNTLNQRDTSFSASTLDAGLKVEFDRQGLWLAGAYRLDNGAVTGGVGLQLSGTDPTDKTIGQFEVDLSVNGSYPLNQSAAFGPEFDLGLIIKFAPRPKDFIQDSLVKATKFWRNDGLLNSHRVKFLDANGPPELQAYSSVEGRRVELTYDWPDNNLIYVGDNPVPFDTLMRRLGFEWIGIDGLMEGIASAVITEALEPDEEFILDPENLEPLQLLTSVKISADLRADYNGSLMGAEGQMYGGELGTNSVTGDTLFIPIVFDDADTLIAIPRNEYISNLELATLKLYALQRRFQFELNRQFGDEMVFLPEGTLNILDYSEGRKIVWLKKIRLTSGYTNQQSFQINRVQLNFRRYKKYVEIEEADPNWTPRYPDVMPEPGEESEDSKEKKQEKEQKKREKKEKKGGNEKVKEEKPEKEKQEKPKKEKKKTPKEEEATEPAEESGDEEWEEEETEWDLPGDWEEEEQE